VSGPVRPPEPHAGGARPPAIAPQLLPRHVALVMDGNGRWAKERGLPRTEGHKRGEHSLFDVIMGAIELGIPYLSAYAFSPRTGAGRRRRCGSSWGSTAT
jgi:undecaprenyl pyrophosphate synthase